MRNKNAKSNRNLSTTICNGANATTTRSKSCAEKEFDSAAENTDATRTPPTPLAKSSQIEFGFGFGCGFETEIVYDCSRECLFASARTTRTVAI